MKDQQPRPSTGDLVTAWLVYALAIGIGVFATLIAPFTVMFTDGCSYHECREWLVPWSLGVTFVGVGSTLLVAGVMIVVAGRRGRPPFMWAMTALGGVLISACGGLALMNAAASDPRPDLGRQSTQIEAALERMPGVQHASTGTGLSFSAVIVLTQEASAEQAKAVVQTFRDQVAGPEFHSWDIDIQVRRGDTGGSFRAGKGGLDSASERVARWLALRATFPGYEVDWIYHTGYRGKTGDIGVGDISLNLLSENDFNAVGEAYGRLAREFPDLSTARWEVKPSERGTGFLQANGRYPNELELSVWNRLNVDQHTPHSVRMTTGSAIIEQLDSSRPNDAELLAEQHLPIVAELGAPIRYTAARDLSGTFGENPTAPLNITIGGCTSRAYPPSPAEQTLAERYEKC